VRQLKTSPGVITAGAADARTPKVSRPLLKCTILL
jgi:hypothetical protein